MTPHIVVAALAGLSSLALAIAGLLVGRPGWIKRSFVFGMVMFSVESFATAMLLGGAEAPGAQFKRPAMTSTASWRTLSR